MTRRLIRIIPVILAVVLFNSLGPAGAADRKQEIADSLFRIELMGGDHLGYCSEILDILDRVYNIRPANYNSYELEYNDGRDFARENFDLYSLLSGGLAIRESLQLDTIRPAGSDKRDRDISSLKAPVIKSHPFNEMLKGRQYRLFTLDRYVPSDFYYVHFSDLARGLDIFDYIDQVGGTVYRRFSMNPVDFRVKEKVLTQLALYDSKEARLFYSKVIEEAAVTGSDPFIIEGSDITLIFRLREPVVFRTTVSSYRRSIQDSFRAGKKTVTVGGVEGELISTPDRRVCSVMLTLPDGTVIISNSLRAAEKVIAVSLGKKGCVADEPDYRYMRSVYPASAESEDGFIFLSDAFVRRMVSPEVRIKEARRMREAMRMALLEKYVIFYYQLNGSYPSSVDDVLSVMGKPPLDDSAKRLLQTIRKSKYHPAATELKAESLKSWDLFKSALSPAKEEPVVKENKKSKKTKSKKKRKPEGPEEYISLLKKFYQSVKSCNADTPEDVFSLMENLEKPGSHMADRFTGLSVTGRGFTVSDSEYGRYGFMTPCIELEAGTVSSKEASGYMNFVDEYNDYWRDYFDPVGVRLRINNGISVETCILPLVNNSLYNSLLSLTGSSPAGLHPDDMDDPDIFSLCLRVNRSGYLAEVLSRLFSGGNYSFNDMFGDEIQVHMGDSLPVTDFDGSFMFEEYMSHGFDRIDAFTGLLVWSAFHPVRIAIPVKKPEQVYKILNDFDAGNFVNRAYLNTDRYSFDYKGNTVRVIKLTVFYSMTYRIYYTIKDGMLHMATTEKYIKSVIDSRKAGGTKAVKGNAVVIFRPGAMVLGRDSFSSGIIESALETSRRNSGTMRLLSLIYPSAGDRELPGLACRDFGFMPVCPLGGEYTVDRRTGEVSNSVYGSLSSPLLKLEKGKDGISDSLKRFFSTKEVRVELEFTPEGLMTRIKTE